MADIGRYNTLPIVKHADFGLYLEAGPYGTARGEILLPRRYIPKDTPTAVGDRCF